MEKNFITNTTVDMKTKTKKRVSRFFGMGAFLFLSSLPLLGCLNPNARNNSAAVQGQGGGVTVGDVQREIHVGMTGSDVVSVLGSPNIVTRGDKGGEVWVYEKISTQNAYSTSQGGLFALILSGGTSGASSSTQKTLTVKIMFNKSGRVSNFTYRSSEF